MTQRPLTSHQWHSRVCKLLHQKLAAPRPLTWHAIWWTTTYRPEYKTTCSGVPWTWMLNSFIKQIKDKTANMQTALMPHEINIHVHKATLLHWKYKWSSKYNDYWMSIRRKHMARFFFFHHHFKRLIVQQVKNSARGKNSEYCTTPVVFSKSCRSI